VSWSAAPEKPILPAGDKGCGALHLKIVSKTRTTKVLVRYAKNPILQPDPIVQRNTLILCRAPVLTANSVFGVPCSIFDVFDVSTPNIRRPLATCEVG
jgi:hypothetical protein